ncbi:hypothetical protein ALC57_13481 [Trachymyrmex cornetzi]|uniref:Uncharacterized protein n=1 Tax=Trachymyrmex cornetzi TaxID=471704 RepID=A0A195DPA1_9HYME|nr:hypothetical protein ALC57_13481 [Trachymyrmex cornetzi]
MPKTSVHLLSRKESERRRAGRNPGERERVGGCVRACVRAYAYTRGKVTYEIKSFAALTTDGQRGSTLRVRATIRGRDEIESIPYIRCPRRTIPLSREREKNNKIVAVGGRFSSSTPFSLRRAFKRSKTITGIIIRYTLNNAAGIARKQKFRTLHIWRVSSDGTRSPEITMNPNSFGLLVTCLPKRAAPTPQYHASKDKLNHGPSCHPQSRRKPARPL